MFIPGSKRNPMKLHFEDNLDYQKVAIEAVADLFRGDMMRHG